MTSSQSFCDQKDARRNPDMRDFDTQSISTRVLKFNWAPSVSPRLVHFYPICEELRSGHKDCRKGSFLYKTCFIVVLCQITSLK